MQSMFACCFPLARIVARQSTCCVAGIVAQVGSKPRSRPFRAGAPTRFRPDREGHVAYAGISCRTYRVVSREVGDKSTRVFFR